MDAPAATMRCPSCGTPLSILEGYVTWCHVCGWNLTVPPQPHRHETRTTRIADAIGRRLGDRLAAELVRAQTLEPRWTPTKVAAYALAGVVHAASLALAVAGVALAVLAFPNVAALVGATLMLGLAILMRPRLGALPEEGVLAAGQAPTLEGLVAETATALEIEPPHTLVITHDFNASWGVVGLRRRRVLTLGAPLLAMLEPQERVALVAHELAHARNGDATRGLAVGSAVGALAEAYGIVGPDEQFGEEESSFGIAFLVRGLLWILSRPLYGLLLLELQLVLRDSQRAEYLADALAARVAGTEATVALHEKLLLSSTVAAVTQAVSRADSDLFAELAAAAARVPARERERRRRAARLEQARLEDTHPPTALRIELLERRERHPPSIVLDPARSAEIDAELEPLHAPLQRRLVDEYRHSLYE